MTDNLLGKRIFKRFVYAYVRKSSNRPVYVGETHDVEKRDRTHSSPSSAKHNPGSLIDLEISTSGRESFDLQILDSVISTNKIECRRSSMILQDKYIKSLKTSTHEGGYNVDCTSIRIGPKMYSQVAAQILNEDAEFLRLLASKRRCTINDITRPILTTAIKNLREIEQFSQS